jgi:hypothetical protein
LFEVQNGEPSGDKGPRLGSRLVEDQVVGTGEELLGLPQATGVDECTGAVPEQGPLIPRLVNRGYRCAARGWTE